MPRHKKISDAAILSVARSLFLKDGIQASTRTMAKLAGVSETVIFQRFGSKKDLFFTAMIPPEAQLQKIFSMQPGQQSVFEALITLSQRIVIYFRDLMPIFLSLISHPGFDVSIFLERHRLPMTTLREQLIAYLNAEKALGQLQGNSTAAAQLLLSHLHHLVLSETIGVQFPDETEAAIEATVSVLWQGLAPE